MNLNRLQYVAFFLLVSCGASATLGAEFMFEATFGNKMLEGQALEWTDSQMLLLARDGAIHHIDPRTAKNARRTAPRFQGFSPSEMRNALYHEYGEGMTVTSTGHYLVVHRRGESDAWAQRFEQLYRAFQSYFRVRGFKLSRPRFPLVAVIFGSRDEYYQHADAEGVDLLPNTLGHYDPKSNRVLMFDRVASNDSDWGATANTIVHEATHQTAYNVGLHSRTTETPTWVVEGLATMFEARGVYQSEAYDTRRSRVNLARLDDFNYYADGDDRHRTIIELVSSDNAFRGTPERAYANSWALTFYLSETRPREYERYLKIIASRPPLANYSAVDRVRDFQSAFGGDIDLLETNFLTWMDELR